MSNDTPTIEYTLSANAVSLDDVITNGTLEITQTVASTVVDNAYITNLYTGERYDNTLIDITGGTTTFEWPLITVDKSQYNVGSTSANFQLSIEDGNTTYTENWHVIIQVARPSSDTILLSSTEVYELSETNTSTEAIFTATIPSSPHGAPQTYGIDNGVSFWYSDIGTNKYYFKKNIAIADYEYGVTNEIYTLTVQYEGQSSTSMTLAIVVKKEYTYVTSAYENYIRVSANINLNLSRNNDGELGAIGGYLTSNGINNAVFKLPTGTLELNAGKITANDLDGAILGIYDVMITLNATAEGNLTSDVRFVGDSITATIEDDPEYAQRLYWPTRHNLIAIILQGGYYQGVGPSVSISDFSISGWVYRENTVDSTIYDQGGYHPGVYGFAVGISVEAGHSNALRFQYSTGGECVKHYSEANAVPLETWVHFTVVVGRGTPSDTPRSAIYINGSQSGSLFTVPSNDLTNDIGTVGREVYPHIPSLIGKVTDLAIWKQTLTQDNITTIKQSGSQMFYGRNLMSAFNVFDWTVALPQEEAFIPLQSLIDMTQYVLEPYTGAHLSEIPRDEIDINPPPVLPGDPDVLTATLSEEQAERHFHDEIEQLKAIYTRNIIESWNFHITSTPASTESPINQYAQDNGRTYPQIFREGESIVLATSHPYTVTVVDMQGEMQVIVPSTPVHAVIEHHDSGYLVTPDI